MGTDENAALAFLQDFIKVFNILNMDIDSINSGLKRRVMVKNSNRYLPKLSEHCADFWAGTWSVFKHYFQIILNRPTVCLGKTKMQIAQEHDQSMAHLNGKILGKELPNPVKIIITHIL